MPTTEEVRVDADTLEVTNFHLGRRQKEALRARARASGTNVAEQIRQAVDAYLTGVTTEELEMLDAATRQTERELAEMNALLTSTNRKADRIFAELARLRGDDAGVRVRKPAASRKVAA